MADETRTFVRGLDIEHVGQVRKDFTLWWQPEKFDEDRRKAIALVAWMKKAFQDRRVLEVGYPWGGRVFPGSKVLDRYDPRPGIDYRMDACDMKGIPDDSFDLVVSMSVLEHVPKFWLAVEEIKRVVAVGGLVYVGVPTVWPYHPGGNYKGQDFDYGGDYWRMNHAAMVSLFEDRFRKLAVWYTPAAPQAGDDPRSGWGVSYLGEKVK